MDMLDVDLTGLDAASGGDDGQLVAPEQQEGPALCFRVVQLVQVGEEDSICPVERLKSGAEIGVVERRRAMGPTGCPEGKAPMAEMVLVSHRLLP